MNDFKAIVDSMQPSFYKKVINQSFGRSLVYLLLLVFIVAVVFSMKNVFMIKSIISKVSDVLYAHVEDMAATGFPEINIDKGMVTSPVTQPFIYKKDTFAFILDTTGSVTTLDEFESGALLTGDKLKIKVTADGRARTEEIDLKQSRIDHLTIKQGDKDKGELLLLTTGGRTLNITKENISKLGRVITIVAAPVILALMFLYLCIAKLVHVFAFSLVSLLINNIQKTKLLYKQLLNVGVYALTVPVLVSMCLTILFPTDIAAYAGLLAYPLLYVTYLWMSITSCKDEPEQAEIVV